MTVTLGTNYIVMTCCWEKCHLQWALTQTFHQRVRNSGEWFYCPVGHQQHYSGPSVETQLRDAQARELALQDQLSAAIREGEHTRQELLRDRQRIANGVCVCCNRSFENVRMHMETQHPDFPLDTAHLPAPYKCQCGRTFPTFRGLRSHQGQSRTRDWDQPDVAIWHSHLTVV